MALSLFWGIWLTTLWICACLSIFSLQKDWNSSYVNFQSFQKKRIRVHFCASVLLHDQDWCSFCFACSKMCGFHWGQSGGCPSECANAISSASADAVCSDGAPPAPCTESDALPCMAELAALKEWTIKDFIFFYKL